MSLHSHNIEYTRGVSEKWVTKNSLNEWMWEHRVSYILKSQKLKKMLDVLDAHNRSLRDWTRQMKEH